MKIYRFLDTSNPSYRLSVELDMPFRLHRLWSDTWWPEYVATGLSLCSMATIIAVLTAYNGQSISNWHFPAGVTINAIVSVLSTIQKSLLAFALSAALGQWKWLNIN